MDLPSPTELNSITPDNEKGGKIKMKKQLGLLEGVAIILGIIFGSGNYNIHVQLTFFFLN